MRKSQAELGEIGIELGYRYTDHASIEDNGRQREQRGNQIFEGSEGSHDQAYGTYCELHQLLLFGW